MGLCLGILIPEAESGIHTVKSQLEIQKLEQLLSKLHLDAQAKEQTLHLWVQNQLLSPVELNTQKLRIKHWQLKLQSGSEKLLRFYPSGAVTPATFFLSSRRGSCEIRLSIYGIISKVC